MFAYYTILILTATFNSLKPIDIVVLKKLSEVVNVVPVIAKSDSLTTEERDAFKERVRQDRQINEINDTNLFTYRSMPSFNSTTLDYILTKAKRTKNKKRS
jgi:septin family protein